MIYFNSRCPVTGCGQLHSCLPYMNMFKSMHYSYKRIQVYNNALMLIVLIEITNYNNNNCMI